MRSTLFCTPVILSLLVLGAHFMRYDHWIGVSASLVLIALLLVRQPWVARLVQVMLIFGALEWLHTLYELVQLRIANDLPIMRMVVILGAVATVTACSALLFQSSTLRGKYGLDRRD